MSLLKQGEKGRNGGAANLKSQLMKLVVWSFFISSVTAGDIAGYVFSVRCRDESAYICVGIGAGSCCGFDGTQTIQSVGYTNLAAGDTAYAWRPNQFDLSCGDVQQSATSGGRLVCLTAGTFGLTGGSWSPGSTTLISEDDVVHETAAAPKCSKIVKPTLMKFNVSDNFWYPVHDQNATAT